MLGKTEIRQERANANLKDQQVNTQGGLVDAVNAILEKKGRDILVMNVREISSFTDYFIICSGTSVRQTQAVSSFIQEKMKEVGRKPRGVEGEAGGVWILLDYEDLIVHVFHEETRRFYNLEGLWADSPSLAIDAEARSIESIII